LPHAADAGWDVGLENKQGRIRKETEAASGGTAGSRVGRMEARAKRGERGSNRLDESMIQYPLGEAKMVFIHRQDRYYR
jgi:hypothetical protein